MFEKIRDAFKKPGPTDTTVEVAAPHASEPLLPPGAPTSQASDPPKRKPGTAVAVSGGKPIRLSKSVERYISAEVDRRLELIAGRVIEFARDAVESYVDNIRQNQGMHVSALSARVDRLEGVKTFPNQVVRHGSKQPDAAGLQGEIAATLRRDGVAREFQAPPMDRNAAPAPSELHGEAEVVSAGSKQ